MIKGKLGNMMKQAQRMQQDLKKIQDELARLKVVGEASGGKVKVILTCNNVMEKVSIDPSMFTGQISSRSRVDPSPFHRGACGGMIHLC